MVLVRAVSCCMAGGDHGLGQEGGRSRGRRLLHPGVRQAEAPPITMPADTAHSQRSLDRHKEREREGQRKERRQAI